MESRTGAVFRPHVLRYHRWLLTFLETVLLSVFQTKLVNEFVIFPKNVEKTQSTKLNRNEPSPKLCPFDTFRLPFTKQTRMLPIRVEHIKCYVQI